MHFASVVIFRTLLNMISCKNVLNALVEELKVKCVFPECDVELSCDEGESHGSRQEHHHEILSTGEWGWSLAGNGKRNT